MMPMTLRSMPEEQQRKDRADTGRRQRGEDRDGMDVALVEHAKHDVDGDERSEDEHAARW